MQDENTKVLSKKYIKEQEEMVNNLYPNTEINVEKFLNVVMPRVIKQVGSLIDNSSKSKTLGWRNNIRFLMGLEMKHSSEDLYSAYELLHKNDKGENLSYDQHVHSLIQEEKFNKSNIDTVVEINDVDRPNPNGMTPMCDIIMMSDDVEGVRNLIEIFKACPLAKSGQDSPLDMARQLGRTEIAKYLETIITELPGTAA